MRNCAASAAISSRKDVVRLIVQVERGVVSYPRPPQATFRSSRPFAECELPALVVPGELKSLDSVAVRSPTSSPSRLAHAHYHGSIAGPTLSQHKLASHLLRRWWPDCRRVCKEHSATAKWACMLQQASFALAMMDTGRLSATFCTRGDGRSLPASCF